MLHRANKVVGFAGGGGSSEAIRLALNCDPDLAMNHWLTAVLAHQRHFPKTEHYCADIFDFDPREWRPSERIAFGWFSPDCTDFSKAKGKAPRSDRIRGLAWSVIPWAAFRMIDCIMLENVEEFADWGPTYRAGHPKAGEPIPERRGETFRLWRKRLAQLGYWTEWRVLNAADYGAPTTRKRLYLIARFVGVLQLQAIALGVIPSPIVWPVRTHAPRKVAASLGLKPWRGAVEIIDFSQDCPSIFLEPDEVTELRVRTGKRVQRPLVPATHRRILVGVDRYALSAAEPCIIDTTQRRWGGDRAHGVRDPMKTIMSSRGGEYALVDAEFACLASVAHGDDPRCWDALDPARTQTGKHDKVLIAGSLVRQMGRSDASDAVEPTPVVMPGGSGKTALSSAFLVRQFGTGGPRDIEAPTATNMAGGERGGEHTQLVTAFMAQGNDGRPGREMVEPVTTLMQRGTQQQFVAAHLDSYYSSGKVGGDGGEPMRAATGTDRHSLVATWLEQANTGMVGHEAVAPVSTIVGLGSTQRLVQARLELDGGPVGRRAKVLEFLWAAFGLPTQDEWDNPTATLDARRKFGLIILGGQVWMIVDIGLRMLMPSELAAAMGLPAAFDLTVDAYGHPISKTHQTQMIGNMVSPPPAAALIAANCPDLIEPLEEREQPHELEQTRADREDDGAADGQRLDHASQDPAAADRIDPGGVAEG